MNPEALWCNRHILKDIIGFFHFVALFGWNLYLKRKHVMKRDWQGSVQACLEWNDTIWISFASIHILFLGCFCEWKDFVVGQYWTLGENLCFFRCRPYAVSCRVWQGVFTNKADNMASGVKKIKTCAKPFPPGGHNVLARCGFTEKMTGNLGRGERLKCSATLKPSATHI